MRFLPSWGCWGMIILGTSVSSHHLSCFILPSFLPCPLSALDFSFFSVASQVNGGPIVKTSMSVGKILWCMHFCNFVKRSNFLKRSQMGFPQDVVMGVDRREAWKKRNARNINHNLLKVASQYMFAEMNWFRKQEKIHVTEHTTWHLAPIFPLLNWKSSLFPFTLMEGSLSLHWESRNSHTLRKTVVEGSLHASFLRNIFLACTLSWQNQEVGMLVLSFLDGKLKIKEKK